MHYEYYSNAFLPVQQQLFIKKRHTLSGAVLGLGVGCLCDDCCYAYVETIL